MSRFKQREKIMEKEKRKMLKFGLGQVVCTRGISEKMKHDGEFTQFLLQSLESYIDCDWGELPKEDKRQNDEAVRSGDDRILAAY